MQAIILAGGLGTRLRPLTYTIPKPLLPILDRPMIEYIISSLPDEVGTVVLAVSHMSDMLVDYFTSRDLGVEIVIVNEKDPLGTGGAIKNVERYIDGTSLVFNGDIISSLDIEGLVKYHRSKKAIGTIALWRVEDPSRYGVVEIDDGGMIHRFLEKVPKEEAPSDLINAGVYVLEPDILDIMEPGVRISIEREVFPKVTDKGLFGYHFHGYWVDAGTAESFLLAQSMLLGERGLSSFDPGTLKDIKLVEPVRISEGSVIGPGCSIGPNVFIGKDTVLGDGCIVENSTLMEGVRVGNGAKIISSLVGARANIYEGAVLKDRIIGYDGKAGGSG